MEQGRGLAHLRVDDAHRRFVPHVSLVSLRGRRVEPQNGIVRIWKENQRAADLQQVNGPTLRNAETRYYDGEWDKMTM